MKYDPYYHAILCGIKMMYSDKAGVLKDYFLASQIIEPMDLSYKWQKFFGEGEMNGNIFLKWLRK